MRRVVDRRGALCVLGLGTVGAAMPLRARIAADTLADLERRSGGRLGVYALDLSSGRVLAHRADERFKLMSSFKGLLTAMVLRRVADRQERLDAPVAYGRADLMAASPVTTAHVDTGAMTVGELCAATMTFSDNAAANLLLRRLGGPMALTAYLRGIGDAITRLDHYEGQDLGGSAFPLDSTTPAAITATLQAILLGPTLPATQRAQWEAWMVGNKVGDHRLRAAFPPAWRVGDRTGTGDGICNDYAFARWPGREPLLVAAYYAAPAMNMAAQEAVLRTVGQIVIAWQEGG